MPEQRCGFPQIETAAGGHSAGDFRRQSTGIGGLSLFAEKQKAGAEPGTQRTRNLRNTYQRQDSLRLRGEGGERDDRPTTVADCGGEEALRRACVGCGQIERGLAGRDGSADEVHQREIVLDFMRGDARVEHIGEQPVVTAVEDAFAASASLREADNARGATASRDRRGSPEVDIPARHDREIEGAPRVVGQKIRHLSRRAAAQCLGPTLVESDHPIEGVAGLRQIENPLQHQSGNSRLRRAAPQIAQKGRAQHPVADEVELHDQDVAARAQIDVAPRRNAETEPVHAGSTAGRGTRAFAELRRYAPVN